MGKRGWIKPDHEVIAFSKECDDIINKGVYLNLMLQVNRLARHAKGVSITSMRQYYHHMDLFVRHLADEFGLKNLANIAPKHLAHYVEERQCEGKSAATVKNDLSAIRYYHDQFDVSTRHILPDNAKLCKQYGISLERRFFGGVNRRWTWEEVDRMVNVALRKGRHDVSHMIQLAASLGLRLHEVVRLSRADSEGALRTGLLHVKGKGGLERDVPLRGNTRLLLQNVMQLVERGNKLFVGENQKAHAVMQSVQSFIQINRDEIVDPTARPDGIKLTYHGLRHLYAFERYQEFVSDGYAEEVARLKVALLIGHSRDDVTRIYLASA